MTQEIVTLDNLDRAKALIAQADITQLREIINRAEALRVYAEQARKGLEVQNKCAEVKIRAERRAGEVLGSIERNPGSRTDLTSSSLDEVTYSEILERNKIPRPTANRWQLEAEIPDNKFEEWLTEIKSQNREITSTGLRRLALQLKPRQSPIASPNWPATSYRTIVIDPPWPIEKLLLDCPMVA